MSTALSSTLANDNVSDKAKHEAEVKLHGVQKMKEEGKV
jgi:hypothetical protein